MNTPVVNKFLQAWSDYYFGMKLADRLPTTSEFVHERFGLVSLTVAEDGSLTMTTEPVRHTKLERDAAESVLKAALATADN
jgi:hypothetical protein